MHPDKLTKNYTNGSITVVWKPEMCIHSTICWKEASGLPSVFNPRVQPWIQMSGSSSERIIEQVKKCPSGALSFYSNDEKQDPDDTLRLARIEISRNGPMIVHGEVLVMDQNGQESRTGNVTAFCRCGLSGNKPYCDGSHRNTQIDGGPA